MSLEEMAELIAEGVWDVPAIETREEFKAVVKSSLEHVVRETFLHVQRYVSGGPSEVLRRWDLEA